MGEGDSENRTPRGEPDGYRADGSPYWYRRFAPGHPHRVGEGNKLAVKHGAWSASIVEPLAAEFMEAYRSECEWWQQIDESSIRSWARTEARIQRISQWLEEQGSELDDDGNPLGASNMLTKLEKLAESLRSKLGLDPLSRARLGRDVAAGKVDMARLMADELERQEREGRSDGDE